MTDDLTSLTRGDHYLGWLGDEPARAVRDEIERMLRQQVPSASLAWVRLLAEPYFLTGGRKLPLDPEKLVLTRAALAVPFELEVASDGGTERLRGVFSWAATGLDAERDDRTYLDLGAEMDWASEMLKGRIYGDAEGDPTAPRPPEPARPWWKRWRGGA